MSILQVEELQQRSLTIPEQARGVVVTDNETLLRANEVLLSVKDLRKEIDAEFDPAIKSAHEAHKKVLELKRKVEAPLVEAEAFLKPQISRYMQEQERKRREEEERLRQEALRQEEERRLAEAAMAEEEGDNETAEAIISEPIYVPPPVVAPSTPKLQGVAIRETYRAQVVDFMALVRAVAAGQAPIQCLKADEVYLNQRARADKKALRIPGVVAYSESNVAAGRR